MAKKVKVRTPETETAVAGATGETPAGEPATGETPTGEMPKAPEVRSPMPPRQRRTILISNDDVQRMEAAFAAGREAVVTAYALPTCILTDGQREKRKAYRQRPDVREKQRAYRRERAKRIREAKKAERDLMREVNPVAVQAS
jgi:hypothetical protein